MADTAYDSDRIRRAIAERRPGRDPQQSLARHQSIQLDKHLYAQRHLIECCFSKLKQFRRVATRFEKTASNYPRRRHSRRHRLVAAVSVHNGLDLVGRGESST